MQEELRLAAKPQRKGLKKEADAAAQRAYDRSYRQAAIESAKAEGAAAGVADAAGGGIDAPVGAVEAARQRALGGMTPKAPDPPQPKAPTPSVQRIKLPDGTEVPESYYDLDAASQKPMVELIKERETKEKDDSAALTAVNTLLDLRAQDNKRVRSLEAQLSTAVAVIESMQKRMDSMDLQVQADKSTALLEQEAGIAAAVTNLSAIRAEAGDEADQHQAEREAAAVEHRQQLEAMAQAVDALRGSVKSSTTLMSERSNAVVDALAESESRQARLGVQLQELEGKADALGQPITRAEVQGLITDAVATEWRAQVDAITDSVVAEVRDQFPTGLGGQRVDSSRTRQLREDANRFQLEATS